MHFSAWLRSITKYIFLDMPVSSASCGVLDTIIMYPAQYIKLRHSVLCIDFGHCQECLANANDSK